MQVHAHGNVQIWTHWLSARTFDCSIGAQVSKVYLRFEMENQGNHSSKQSIKHDVNQVSEERKMAPVAWEIWWQQRPAGSASEPA